MLVFTVIPLLLSTFVVNLQIISQRHVLIQPFVIQIIIQRWDSKWESGMQSEVNKFNTQPVHEHLNKKYDTHFNFFLTKTTNEIIYNHVLCPNFIDFKDQIIFADNN